MLSLEEPGTQETVLRNGSEQDVDEAEARVQAVCSCAHPGLHGLRAPGGGPAWGGFAWHLTLCFPKPAFDPVRQPGAGHTGPVRVGTVCPMHRGAARAVAALQVLDAAPRPAALASAQSLLPAAGTPISAAQVSAHAPAGEVNRGDLPTRCGPELRAWERVVHTHEAALGLSMGTWQGPTPRDPAGTAGRAPEPPCSGRAGRDPAPPWATRQPWLDLEPRVAGTSQSSSSHGKLPRPTRPPPLPGPPRPLSPVH